jgi:GTPase SAR1 family protein
MQDTAGQERYRTITNSYYRGAHGIFIVYDVCNKDTFDSLPKWIEETEIHSSATQPVVRYIVGNKIDEKELRVVSTQQALDFIESIQPLNPNKRMESKEQSKSQPFYKEYTKANSSSTNNPSPVIPQSSTRSKPFIDGYFEVSAKNTDGVRNMFVSMVEQIVGSGVLDPPLRPQTSRITNYSSWSVPSLVDLSYPFTKPVEKCYSTSC